MNLEIKNLVRLPSKKKKLKRKKKKGKKPKKLETDDLMKEVQEQERQLEKEVERSKNNDLKRKLDKFFLLEQSR